MNKIKVMSLAAAVVLLITSCVDPVTPEQEEVVEVNPFVGTWVSFYDDYDEQTSSLYAEKFEFKESLSGIRQLDEPFTYTFVKNNTGSFTLTITNSSNQIFSRDILFNDELDYLRFSGNTSFYYKQNTNSFVGTWINNSNITLENGSFSWKGTFIFTTSKIRTISEIITSNNPDYPVSTEIHETDYFIKRNNSSNISIYFIDSNTNYFIRDLNFNSTTSFIMNSNTFNKQ